MSEIIEIDNRQRIEQILDGKREEYAWFVKTYSQQVLDFTSRMMPDSEDAKEVAQDAFVKAFQALGSFKFQSSFCTWVCRIAYHLSLDRLKRQHPHYVDIDNMPAILPSWKRPSTTCHQTSNCCYTSITTKTSHCETSPTSWTLSRMLWLPDSTASGRNYHE